MRLLLVSRIDNPDAISYSRKVKEVLEEDGVEVSFDEDTAESLAERILKEEHRIYPQAVQYFAEDKIEIVGRRVRIRNGRPATEKPFHNPPLVSYV